MGTLATAGFAGLADATRLPGPSASVEHAPAEGEATMLREAAVPAEPPPRSETQATRFLAEQVKLAAPGAYAGLGNLLSAGIIALLFWNSYPQYFLIAWLAATALVAAFRFAVFHRYQRLGPTRPPAVWAHSFIAGALLSATCWGAIAIAGIWSGGLVEHAFVGFVICGITAAALGVLAPFFRAYLGFLALTTGCQIVSFLVLTDPIHLGLGLLSIAYFAVLAGAARTYNRYIFDTIRLQIENRDLNEQLTAARRTVERVAEEKWETLAHLSHELRTPMNAVLGFSDALQQQMFGPHASPKYLEYSRHINESGTHILELVDEILGLAKAEANKLTLTVDAVDIVRMAKDCAAMLSGTAQERDIALELSLPDAPPGLAGDRLKLRQVLLNLISNGIKYTPAGGTVRVAVRATGAQVIVAVSDTGIGMDEDEIPKALEPFVRLSNPLTQNIQGTGLGLPVSKRLVELHGGTLGIVSARHRGTVVTVSLPACPPERN